MAVTPIAARERAVVSTDWLAGHLDDAGLRIFDCTTYLRPADGGEGPYRVESGRAEYDQGHIPGAGFIDVEADLSRHDTDLHFMRPAPEAFATAMGRLGVGSGNRVILYSAGHIMWATRVWWMLRAYGFDDAAVLDGGWEKWSAEGRPVSTDPCAYPPATFNAEPRPELFVDRDEVKAVLGAAGTCIINALTEDFHRGESESRYGRPGRIPGSVNVPGRELTQKTKELVSLDEAAEKFAAVGADRDKRIITYCGGGIAATVDNLMLYRLGYDNVATYDASMGEWASDDSLPIETG
jgi:thiosulfate/3-mercaptopyruvate sulfurtransferase